MHLLTYAHILQYIYVKARWLRIRNVRTSKGTHVVSLLDTEMRALDYDYMHVF